DPSELRDALAERAPTPATTAKTSLVEVLASRDRDRALTALVALNPRRAAGYHDWLRVGMALHWTDSSTAMLAEWDRWSKLSPEKYQEGACAEKWATFKHEGDKTVTLASLIWWAKQDGQSRSGTQSDPGTAAAIILAYWQQRYDFTFRRGAAVYASALAREM